MARKLEGRVRYDQETDSFIYETCTVNEIEDEYGEVVDEEIIDDWGMCLTCPCVRREGAEDGEDANYIHYSMLKQVVADAWNLNVRIHLA